MVKVRKVHLIEDQRQTNFGTRCGIRMVAGWYGNPIGEFTAREAHRAQAVFVTATTAREAVTCARCLSPNRGGPLAGSTPKAQGKRPLRR